jgi:subtilisin family serine protease
VLVKLRAGYDEEVLRQASPSSTIERLVASPNPTFRARGFDRLYRVRSADGLEREAARRLARHPAVEYAQIDASIRSLSWLTRDSAFSSPSALDLPDDPLFPEAWSLHNTGQTGGTPDADIDAPEAWQVSRGAGVVVAVLDSGVDYDHPDLAANIWSNPGEVPGNGFDDDGNGYVDDVRGWDFFNGDNDPFDDGSGHGTHVAGIIAAIQNNAMGSSGVGPELEIMPLKIQSDRQVGSVSAAIEAIHYAVTMGAAVLSNSWAVSAAWGEPGFDQPGFSPALRDAVLAARDAGVLFVAAAGNSAIDLDDQVLFPASYNLENTVTVAATDPDDLLASWSNFGPYTVELGAPGYSIVSTVPQDCNLLGPPPTTRSCDGSGYQIASGTSMAAPHVAGVLGLLRARHPDLPYRTIKEMLLTATDPLPTLSGLTISGGRLNAGTALMAVPPAEVGVPEGLDPSGWERPAAGAVVRESESSFCVDDEGFHFDIFFGMAQSYDHIVLELATDTASALSTPSESLRLSYYTASGMPDAALPDPRVETADGYAGLDRLADGVLLSARLDALENGFFRFYGSGPEGVQPFVAGDRIGSLAVNADQAPPEPVDGVQYESRTAVYDASSFPDLLTVSERTVCRVPEPLPDELGLVALGTVLAVAGARGGRRTCRFP